MIHARNELLQQSSTEFENSIYPNSLFRAKIQLEADIMYKEGVCYLCKRIFLKKSLFIGIKPSCEECLKKIPKHMRINDFTISKYKEIFNVCERCGWNESTCDIHHIIPLSTLGGNNKNNFICLCPNCHRLVHTFKYKIDWNTKKFIHVNSDVLL